ncbi:iron ABC transporter permease [Duncaniella sp.]|uniref:iron ABC transporter permease n=1 Tax=Duncaniella sp. TaxID=2518496 RepID=UPI0023C513EC|nr:iron ABC transporter permease [Duncaniella sp.]MDE5904687.1 iron ABC transporter permease [Duncaniella sp.]
MTGLPALSSRRERFSLWGLLFLTLALFVLCLFIGSVDIPAREVLTVLTGGEPSRQSWSVIVIGSRLITAIVALLSGSALAIAGLMLQTTFANPLAGPSILGVSTGSSLGVAIVMLAFGGTLGFVGESLGIVLAAIAGAMLVLALLLLFSRILNSSVMLLIVGILVGYLSSSAVSLLNFFATQEGVHSFVIWGLGSFSGVSQPRLLVFAPLTLTFIALSMLMVKPLDAMLLGDAYAANLGVNVRRSRNRLLILSGVLTAVVTAFCGPIAFVGMVVPHVARLLTRSSRHLILMPATALAGAALGLLCVILSVMPGSRGIIPVNAITPVIGVPVILYVILNRHRLNLFG